MLLKTLESDPGRDLSRNIKLGSTLSGDQHLGEGFHYGVSNPPFGKKWESIAPGFAGTPLTAYRKPMEVLRWMTVSAEEPRPGSRPP